jgi:AcrR family transcriptional regulator
MARTRSENYDGIQGGILNAACALFAQQGYMRASIADLADACKLSRGALYHYFDSKEAILFAILDAHVRRMISDVKQAMAQQSTNLDRFRAAIRAIVELNARSSNEQRLILNDLSFLSETEQTAIKALERKLVDTVSDLLIRLDTEGKMGQALEEGLRDDVVRHAELQPHLVRPEGRHRARGIRRHGGGSVFPRLCRGGREGDGPPQATRLRSPVSCCFELERPLGIPFFRRMDSRPLSTTPTARIAGRATRPPPKPAAGSRRGTFPAPCASPAH